MNQRVRHLLAALTCFLSFGVASAGQGGYRLVVLPGVTGAFGSAQAINDFNVIGGYSAVEGGASHATVWQDLVPLEMGTPSGLNSAIYAINNLGVVAGSTQTTNGNIATRWNSGVPTYLPTAGGSDSAARGINDAGVVVGYSESVSNPGFGNPVSWDANGIHQLATLGSPGGGASAVDQAGTVVGSSFPFASANGQATLWNSGVPTALPQPEHQSSGVWAINSSGVMAGFGQSSANGYYHAARWVNREFARLPELSLDRPSYAAGINDAGAIVGWTDDTFALRATAWIGDEVVDLNGYLAPQEHADGIQLTYAFDINNNGWIVGQGYNFQSGQGFAFALVPVPEPSAAALLLVGMAAVQFVRRGRPSKSRRL